MAKKLFLSLGSLAVILLLSGVISIVEYGRMSNELSHKLAEMTREYNDQMLIMADSVATFFDVQAAASAVDSITLALDSSAAALDFSVESIMKELSFDSADVDENLYRCIIPVAVSGGAGLLLILLLLYFIMVYYVKPMGRMSDGVDAYRLTGRRYVYEFDGDDQLANINSGLTELIEENVELKNRVKNLRDDREKLMQNISDLTAE